VKDTDPDFDRHVALLAEAARLEPKFEVALGKAKTDDDVHELVTMAEGIVRDHSDQAWM
jgi:hypothetical protein